MHSCLVARTPARPAIKTARRWKSVLRLALEVVIASTGLDRAMLIAANWVGLDDVWSAVEVHPAGLSPVDGGE